MSPTLGAVDLGALQDAIADEAATLSSIEAVLGAADNSIEYDYLTIGEDEEIEAGTQCVAGSSVRVTLHIWTQEKGFTRNKAIACDLRNLLDEEARALRSAAPLTVANHKVIGLYFESARYMRDPNVGVAHGVIAFNVEIEASNS